MLRRKPSNASEKEHVQKKEQAQKKEPAQKKKLTLQRSSSFKDFMKHKPTSPVVSDKDKEFTLDETVSGGLPVDEHEKTGSKLGKKWRKVISRTMSRKTSKMVQKALAEEEGTSGDEASLSPVIDGLPDLRAGERSSVCSSGSEDTTPRPVYRQLSGSSDRQSLDSGYSQRDSMRLEENGHSYNGPFCGRALVHTDFLPSPYDVESLKLQKGDIIHIIDKPPVGTWTGKLNNKVGSFKFIYVNILPDDGPPARRNRSRSKTHHDQDRPKTLEEVLESIGLSDLCSLLSMHGFQTLEDFAGLKESHLNELNITNAEQRAKILNATEQLRDSEDDSDEEDRLDSSEEDTDKEPRDSGCFESSDNLENGRSEDPLAEGELQKHTSSEEQDQESGKQSQECGEQEENQAEQLDSVQEQLEELTVK